MGQETFKCYACLVLLIHSEAFNSFPHGCYTLFLSSRKMGCASTDHLQNASLFFLSIQGVGCKSQHKAGSLFRLIYFVLLLSSYSYPYSKYEKVVSTSILRQYIFAQWLCTGSQALKIRWRLQEQISLALSFNSRASFKKMLLRAKGTLKPICNAVLGAIARSGNWIKLPPLTDLCELIILSMSASYISFDYCCGLCIIIIYYIYLFQVVICSGLNW